MDAAADGARVGAGLTRINAVPPGTEDHQYRTPPMAAPMNRSSPLAVAPSCGTVSSDPPPARAEIQHAIDQAYRDLVSERQREDWTRRLCIALGAALGSAGVMLVRRHEGGTLEVEATSRESALWAELLRLPERCDSTIVGDGPAARALRTGSVQTLMLRDEGLLPWREAARRDGVIAVHAAPFEAMDLSWALLACDAAPEPVDRADAMKAAAAGCARLFEDADRLERNALLAAALRQAGNAAFITNVQGELEWSNAAFSRLTGYEAGEVLGRNPRFLGSGRHGVRHYRELWNTIRSGRIWHGETVDRDRSGHAFTALQTISPFGVAGTVTHYLALYDDITPEKQEDLRRQLRSERDPLTGLMHRAALEARLSGQLQQGQPVRIGRLAARRPAAIEELGPDAMDRLVGEVQERLGAIVGTDHVARLAAGDYLMHLPGDAAAADRVVALIERAMAQPDPVIGALPAIDLRVAVAASPEDGTDVDTLLRSADRRLGIEPFDSARRRLPRAGDGPSLRARP